MIYLKQFEHLLLCFKNLLPVKTYFIKKKKKKTVRRRRALRVFLTTKNNLNKSFFSSILCNFFTCYFFTNCVIQSFTVKFRNTFIFSIRFQTFFKQRLYKRFILLLKEIKIFNNLKKKLKRPENQALNEDPKKTKCNGICLSLRWRGREKLKKEIVF